ncbi:piggyBac transposable element-derived protein 3-like [Liolophura sinensis]|uniref:piggyBac transposable element-derived protein 3-like n=1 Tax=Liolophura sinensis TaxID=3198878 RepID=UPI0031594374
MLAKQVIKSKPNPVGIKNWVLCGKSGRALDFELYQRGGTGIPEQYRHLGLGASVVLRLSESVPKDMNYKLCFDNYFTGIPLLWELKLKGILSLGTIKANRLMGCALKNEKQLGHRGASDTKVSAEGDICVVRWLDNGVVTLESTMAGDQPRDQVRRWSESAKTHIFIDRPYAVQVYNDYMGGVDKLDFLISLYRINAKTRKWPVRMIFHFLDFALANAWLEYRNFEVEHGTPKRQVLDLLSFRSEVGQALI